MAGAIPLLLAIVPLALWYAYSKLTRWRLGLFKGIPHPPTSIIFGHLKLLGELMAKGHPKRHTGSYGHFLGP